MALKPTIYKFKIMLSDMNRDYYDSLSLTVAQHPSENIERMMVRVLAYCLNAQQQLSFTKGLSEPEVPDIEARSLDDRLQLRIDVGEPAVERIKKAARVAEKVKVYSFNSKSDVWWSQEQKAFSAISAELFQVPWKQAQALAGLVDRTVDMSMTISGNSAYIAAEKGDCEVTLEPLQTA